MSTSHSLFPCRILLFVLLLHSGFSFCQTEQLGYLEDAQSTMIGRFSISSNSEWLIVRKNWRYDFWKVNYTNGTYELLDSLYDLTSNAQLLTGTNGLFYSSYEFLPNGNDVQYFIHHTDTNGVKTVSGIISVSLQSNSEDYGPQLLQVINNELYYSFREQGSDHELWKSGTDLSNPVSVYNFPEKIIRSFVYQDSLIVVTKGTGDYSIYNCSVAGGVQLRYTLSCTQNQGSIHSVGTKDNEYFLSVYHNPGHNTIWKTDFTQAGTTVYIDSASVGRIEFDEYDRFILTDYSSRMQLWTGDYNDPENRVKIPFASGLEGYSTQIDLRLSDSVFRLLTYPYGVELAHIQNDTIRMMKDLAPGGKSGVIGNPESYSYSPFVLSTSGSDTCYLIMSNGNDGLKYLYSVKGGVYDSYFPMEHPEEIISGNVNGNYVYWFRNNASGLQLERRSLVSGLQPQPEGPLTDSSLVWSREFGYPAEYYGYWQSQFNPDYNAGCELLEDGSVLGCFMVRDFYNNPVMSSEGYYSDSLKAGIILFKYDPYGNIKWTQSLGDKNTIFFTSPQLVVDSDGNIMVSGTFFKDGYFGANIELVSRAAFFLAKLDGETGEILWHKTIAESFYVDDIEMQEMTIGENNSVYLSVLYRNFDCTLDGITLYSQVSPLNAVAKFNADGEIEWFKNTPTPWTDYYGNTYMSEYNPETEKLISCQSQGYYNTWSSCQYQSWNYYFQVMDQSGNNLQQHAILTNDLGGMTTGVFSGESLMAFGYFRGTMEIDGFVETTPYDGSCHTNVGFQLIYSPEKNRMTAMQTSTEPFYPLDSKSYGINRYVYGTDRYNNLLVIRFNQKGEETGYKMLGQRANPFDFGDDQFFDVSNEYLLFFGSYFDENNEYSVYPQYAFPTYKSIVKTENANWQTDKVWFEQNQFGAFEHSDQDVVVFPNPFTDQVTIVFQGFEAQYTHYELWDVNGRKVTTGTFGTEVMQSLDFGSLNAGAYVLKLIAESKQTTVRMVKI